MDLYVLDANFWPVEVVEDFDSAIWTERFLKAGDVELVVPLTQENLERFPQGTFLGLTGSKEVMFLDTFERENGRLKIKGNTLDKFLDERVVRASSNAADRYWEVGGTAGGVMMLIVRNFVIAGGGFTGGPILHQVIPGLMEGPLDGTGPTLTVAVPYGPIYTALADIAETYKVGFSLQLSGIPGTPLLFTTYTGVDRTADVEFSDEAGSLGNVKELYSNANHKNVAYAWSPTADPSLGSPVGVVYEPGFPPDLEGFSRRILHVLVEDITEDNFSGTPAALENLLGQRARNALANNNYIKVVDGEVLPNNPYTFGVDYNLGDLVQLRSSTSGLTQTVRVDEFIRTQDKTGERAYPTISVVE